MSINLPDNFRRGNSERVFEFNESSNLHRFVRQVVASFKAGVTCFCFRLRIKGRAFEDRVALRPEIHDETDAQEMAQEQFAKFAATVEMVLSA